MIIDVHTHLAKKGSFEQKSFEHIRAAMLKEMKANKVDAAFVLADFRDYVGSPMLDETVELTRGQRQLYALGTIDVLHYSADDVRKLDVLLGERAIVGLKLWPGYASFYPTDKRCRAVYELCMKHDVPVLFHSGDTYRKDAKVKYAHPLHFDEVAVDFPDLKIIIAHAGNPWMLDCAEVVYKNKNVYADISGLGLGTMQDVNGAYARKRLKEFMAFAPARKLLYGTDWPLVPMKSYLKFARSLGIKKDDMEYVFSKNAINLFNLKI